MHCESEKIIVELEEELKDLYQQYKNAGLGTEGEILNQIRNKEHKIKRLKALANTKSPENSNINIYILTGLKKQILGAIDNTLAEKIPEGRNGKAHRDWIPYMTENKTIDNLLSEFKAREGYPFSPVYLDDKFDIKTLTEIDKDITDNSVVAVVDLLAINEKNTELAKSFNTSNIRQLLLPICDNLDNSLQNYMKDKRKQVYYISETRLNQGDCDFADSPRENNYFIMQLKNRFPVKGKISNNLEGLETNLNGINNIIL